MKLGQQFLYLTEGFQQQTKFKTELKALKYTCVQGK